MEIQKEEVIFLTHKEKKYARFDDGEWFKKSKKGNWKLLNSAKASLVEEKYKREMKNRRLEIIQQLEYFSGFRRNKDKG